MAEEAGGTVWQKPQWKDWGGMDGYSGYFLDPDGYPWEVAYAPFLRLAEDNRLLPKTKAEVQQKVFSNINKKKLIRMLKIHLE